MKKILGLAVILLLGFSHLFAQGNSEAETEAMLDKLMSDTTLLKGAGGNYAAMMQNLFKACTIEPSYSFTSEVVSDMYLLGKNPKDSFSMRQIIYSNSTKNILGMSMNSHSKKMEILGNSKSIINIKDSCVIMLMETPDGKSAMSMKMGQENKAISDSSINIKPPIKTGESKMILGILCYEYLSENEDWKMQMWVNEKDANMWDAFSTGNKTITMPSVSTNGMPLEMVMNNLKESKTIYYFVRSYNKNKTNTISTVGYKQF